MRHIPDGVLRRLEDEPLAVPDRAGDHLNSCERCTARRADIAGDSERAARLLSAPQPVPDIDIAWSRIQRELERSPEETGARAAAAVRRRRARLPRVSLRAGLAIAAIGVVVAGTAAAATLTTIFAPTHVAPLSLSENDLRAIAAFTGLGDSRSLGGFTTSNGSATVRFGTMKWSSSDSRPAASLSQASAEAGLPVTLPAHLPAGVGKVQSLTVQPRLTATVTFDSRAATLDGSAVTIDAGPAVLAQYSAASGSGVPVLAVTTARRPTAHSTGASMSQIEAFLLRQPGISPELAEEIRLLGDLRTTLPVPVPPGATVHSIQIDGHPGVALADASNAAAAVIWEDGRGLLHAVVGIVDSRDALDVARQLG